MAARATGAAEGDETLGSAAVRDALANDDRFPLQLAGTYTLKGIPGSQDLFRLDQTPTKAG
jgi:class 3 adenylate cyclase